MCPHTAPISKAGKAAASAAGRLLRAFEAELAPVVEAISQGAMVRRFFHGLPSRRETRLMPFFFSFSRLLRGEKSSSWLQLFDADCEITRHFSSRPHAEELKRAPARVPLKKQRRAFFSVVEVARPLARSRASLLSPLSLFLFLRAISLSFLIFFLSRAKGIRSHLVLTAIESSIQQKKNSGSECPSLGRRGASPGSRSRRARPRPRARDQQRLRLYYAHLVVVCRGAPVGPTGARE